VGFLVDEDGRDAIKGRLTIELYQNTKMIESMSHETVLGDVCNLTVRGFPLVAPCIAEPDAAKVPNSSLDGTQWQA
jgi:hypothetical protein